MAFEQPGGRRGGRRSGRDAVGAESEISTTTLPDGEMNTHLVERFRRGNRFPNAQNAYTSAFTNGLDLKLNTDIRDYVGKQEQITQSAERDTWLSQPEIPTKEELAIAEPALPANKVNAPWRSKEKYLRTQYALLREDAVGNLREAVQDFAKSPTTGDTQKFAVYDKVYILGFTFARKGLAARIQFSTKRAGKRILWQSTKRLTSGTLVALVRANDKLTDLQGVVIAVVAARPLAGVLCQPPQIDIYFGSPADVQIDPQQEWIMIEAKQGYYEAYRHSLRALQKLSQEAFPLSNEICHFASNTEPPTYVQENPTLNLSAAAKPEEKKQYSNVDVTKPWPPPPKDTLDDTQWQALEQILTKRLAIVQGPPGCGKTYISKIAVQILQENRKDDDPPIIIAAQTNHALDQLLGHISRFDAEYIRLGGRSTNADVKQRALYEIRQRERIKLVPGGLLSKTNNLLTKQVKAMTALLGPLAKPGPDLYSTDVASAPQTLLQLGVLTDKQAKSLEDGASRWVSTVDTVDGAIRLWLDRFIMPFEVRYAQDDFGFEDAVEDDDLEFEQLRENEDATGINDEEDIELLKGPWTAVVERFTVSPCSSTDLVQAAKILDSPTTNDLWKVPEYLRKPMFAVMQSRAKAAIAAKFREAAAVYDKLVKDCLIGKWEQDSVYLSRAKIIGMTTTGLSKYRPLISALKPKIILIEEAAEVLEAPVTVACIPSLQHLILVGDHQQLQGHCSVQELEGEPFNLNISLFERLVKNNMPYKTLLRQRRMDPEFRRLISDLYPSLTDHPSVVGRPAPPWGMGPIKSFFFDHQWSEYRDESQSIYNEEEAKFIAGFYRYLIKNGLGPEHITVLTFYNGQRKKILKELKAYPELRQTYCAVKTVDSYQGEESNIVILSLARSNPEAKIGFLANNNRVCVALSRAKFGFYLFGNADNLMRGSPLWYNVITLLDSKPKRLGQVFPIQCQNHKTTLLMQYPDDWQELDGGCSKPCNANLKCGHPCPLRCHPFDHDKVECPELCNETMVCGHGCEAKCSQPCLCTCDDFSRLKREQAMKGRPFPQDSRTSHLRKQCSTRNPANRGMKSTANPTDMQSKRNPPLQPAVSRQDDARRRQTWTTFAKGGVVADDKQKADVGKDYDGVTRKEADQRGFQVASPTLEFGAVKVDEEPATKKETVTVMQRGRNQFMHEYTPAAFRRNQDLLDIESGEDDQTLEADGRGGLAPPPAGQSKSERAPGEALAQHGNKVGGNDPASTREQQKSGGDVMDAFGDLLEYFRTV